MDAIMRSKFLMCAPASHTAVSSPRLYASCASSRHWFLDSMIRFTSASQPPAAPDGNALGCLVVGFRIVSFRFQAAGEPER